MWCDIVDWIVVMTGETFDYWRVDVSTITIDFLFINVMRSDFILFVSEFLLNGMMIDV